MGGRQRWVRFCSACLVVLAWAAIGAAQAAGHATVESTLPERGAQLERAPATVEFEFSEPVETSFGSIRVFDAEGEEIQEGEPFRPEDDSRRIAARLPADLPDGAYTATYSVISADSHPVSGGIVFTIGSATSGPALSVTELIGDTGSGPVTQAGFWLVRLLGYLAIALSLGLIVFFALCWRPAVARTGSDGPGRATSTGTGGAAANDDGNGAPDRAESEADAAMRFRSARLLWVAMVAGIAAALLSFPLQAATAGGSGFFSVLGIDQARAVLDTRFGTAQALRLAGWLALIPAVVWLGRPGSSARSLLLVAALPATALLLAPGLGGHAASQSEAAVLMPANGLHMAATAVWIGGIAALVLALPQATRQVPDRAQRARLLTRVLLAFSGLALVSVAVLTLTGMAQTVLLMDSVGDLWQTAFGRTVLLKVSALLVLIGFGAIYRRRLIPALVRQTEAGSPLGALGLKLRRNMRGELAVGVVAIGLAAALVSYSPNPADEGPVTGLVAASPLTVDYILDPATQGSNEIHIYLFDEEDGAPWQRVKEIDLDLSLPEREIGPVSVDLVKAGPGHYTVPSVPFPSAGEWVADLTVRWTAFDQVEAEFELPIG